MKHILTIFLITIFSICFNVSSVYSDIIYSGPLNIAGPNLNIDINNDGSNDFVAYWKTWAAGTPWLATLMGIEYNGSEYRAVGGMVAID